MIKINKNLAIFSGLFLFLGIILFFTIQKLFPLIGHATYYCQSFISTHMIPIPYFLSVIPIAFLFLILIISFIKFFVLTLKIQTLKYSLKGKIAICNPLSNYVTHPGLNDKTVVIQSNEKFAFCLGIRIPKIYISTGLISQLSLGETEAVLRHEQYHLENRDTLTMIIASVAHSLFPFFPLISDLIKKYRVEREIEADKFAISKIGDQYALISALKKLLAFPSVETVALAAIADQDTLEPRIYSLVNKPYIRRQFRIRHFLITLFSSLVFVIIIVLPVNAKEVHHEDHDVLMLCADGECINSCISKKNLNKLYSEIPGGQKISTPDSFQPYTPMH